MSRTVRSGRVTSGYADGSGTVTWGITVGLDGGGQTFRGTVGFSAEYTPPSGPTFPKNVDNIDQGGGQKHYGRFGVVWPMQAYTDFYAMWPIFVLDQKAQSRLYDKVTFLVQLSIHFDTFNGLWWFGNNAWEYWSFVLGDGTWNGSNLLDQYTSIQSGY
ncbi:MAG: hypothetical protein ACT4OI_08425, partial [Methanobacteriota archaeon]